MVPSSGKIESYSTMNNAMRFQLIVHKVDLISNAPNLETQSTIGDTDRVSIICDAYTILTDLLAAIRKNMGSSSANSYTLEPHRIKYAISSVGMGSSFTYTISKSVC